MLRLALTRDSLSMITDQFGTPPWAELLADVSAHLIRSILKQPHLGGLYHLAASGETNRHAYARLVLERAACRPQGVRQQGYYYPLQRPSDSGQADEQLITRYTETAKGLCA